MLPAEYNFQDHTSGDTFIFPTFQLMLEIDVTPKNVTGARVDMYIRRNNAKGPIVGKWSTEDDTIVLTDPVNGKIKPQQRLIDYTPGVYVYDVQVTENEDVQTVVHGEWTIIPDVTP